MQPTTQDFNNNTDYTAQNLSGNLLNTGFALLQGNKTVDNQSGIVPVIWTLDSALNTPLVPDPNSSPSAAKWVNYIWYRLPFNTDTTSPAKIYTWNQNAASAPTFLQWIDTTFDDTAILAQLATLSTTANTALNAANTANTNSSNALTNSNAAVTVATNAANSVAQAESDASAAAVAATTANNTATAASATANGASAVAANALAIAQQSKTIANLTPGGTGQRIRVNYANQPSLEYFNVKDTITILTESYGTGTAGIVNGSGIGTARPFNTIKTDTGGQVVLVGGNAQFVAGTYRYDITVKVNRPAANGGTSTAVKLVETTGVVTIDTASELTTTTTNTIIRLQGVIAITATQMYSIVMFNTSTFVSGGIASNIAGVNEIYTTAVFERIG